MIVVAQGERCSPEILYHWSREAIAALWAEYGQSRADGDAGRWLAIHDPEALKMPQDGPMFRIAEVSGALQAAWAKQDENTTMQMLVQPLETVVRGDYAYSMGTYTKRTTAKGGGEPVLFEGKFLTILRKDGEGHWLIYRDCYNSSTPPAAPASGQYSFGTPVNLGPRINSAQIEGSPRVSADGLELYFNSNRSGGSGGSDIWVATRPTMNADWGEAVNLGPIVNSAANEIAPAISADGLELYFADYRVNRPGGIGKSDLWVSRRPSSRSAWGEPVNLGPVVNTAAEEITPEISADGLELYFETDRPGGLGSDDLWVARRATISDNWGTPVWLGKAINGKGMDHCPSITSDGLTLFFDKNAPGEEAGDLMATRRATLKDNWPAYQPRARAVQPFCFEYLVRRQNALLRVSLSRRFWRKRYLAGADNARRKARVQVARFPVGSRLSTCRGARLRQVLPNVRYRMIHPTNSGKS